jgi:hypothetical protein
MLMNTFVDVVDAKHFNVVGACRSRNVEAMNQSYEQRKRKYQKFHVGFYINYVFSNSAQEFICVRLRINGVRLISI